MTYRHFNLEDGDGVVVVQLVDPKLFDSLMVSELEDELLDYLNRQTPEKMLVDFDGVTHCSTAVINGLLRAKKRLLANGGKLGLCGMTNTIREAYRMLNLDGTVFKIYEDRTHGLNAMKVER